MKKTLLSVAILSTGFGLVGCNDVDQNGELCSYYVKQDMNAKDFDSALTRLDTQSCQDSYESNAYMVDQGTAYMGRAGTTLPDIMFSVMDSGDEGSEQDDSFQTFVDAMTTTQTSTALTDLKSADDALVEYLDGYAEDEKLGVRLINSMLNLAQTASALNNLLGGELDSWFNDDPDSPNFKLERATCALETINDIADSTCDDTDVITSFDSKGNGDLVTFAYDGGSTDYYAYSVTDANGISETFLAGATQDFMVMTEGFCTTNNYAAGNEGDAGVYPCPISRSGAEEMKMEEYLLTTLKGGVKNIETVIGNLSSVSEEDKADILESVSEFKSDIVDESQTAFEDIEIEDLLVYLNKSEND
jgi:hypothetical protein